MGSKVFVVITVDNYIKVSQDNAWENWIDFHIKRLGGFAGVGGSACV